VQAFSEAFQHGGFPMWSIVVLGLVGAAIALERIVRLLTRLDTDGRALFSAVRGRVILDDVDGAIALCRHTPHATVARVLEAGLSRADRRHEDIEAELRATCAVEVMHARRRFGLLTGLANLAIQLGLVGTVFGMITGFTNCATVSAEHHAQHLYLPVVLAVYSTGFALAVAIPLLAAHLFIRARTDKVCDEALLYAAKLRNLLWIRLGRADSDFTRAAADA
jgi:biopolymer transport protein ExbB/TolQ